MKSIKMLGFAALTALMAMAFMDASSAMATNTQLCKADESPCLAGNVVSHIHEETLTGAKAKLLSSLGAVECDVLFLGDSLGLGAPLVIHGHLTYTNCSLNGGGCTVTETSIDSLISLLRISHETAEITFITEFTVHCGAFINCTYNGVGLKGTDTGPLLSSFTNGDTSLSEQTTEKVGSGLCPKTNKLDISMMQLSAVYVITP